CLFSVGFSPTARRARSRKYRLYLRQIISGYPAFRLGDQTCDRQHPLVIEDDRLNRDLISMILRIDGHGVVEACDAVTALEVASTMHFDLVITDFVMPKLNGFKFLKQLHALQPRLPIIFITGYRSAISRTTMLEESRRFFRSLLSS